MSTENDRDTADRQEETRPVFYPSAMILSWGLVLLIGGQLLFTVGLANAVMNALSGALSMPSGFNPAMVIGAIAAVIGLVMVLNGVWRLAGHVDRLARHLYRP